ncbi:MAG TPA: L,D-transpeptidase [Candidatus Acidoferrales bacterium]|nr:L,D-transpeptidase [Candidatus Acidoferrales bacterium]
MRGIEDRIKKLATLTGVVLMATAEALAQDWVGRPSRKVVISIPDRKLAVIDGDRVVRIFDTAVGAAHSPSPTGTYKIISSVEDPTWYHNGRTVPPGPHNPLGTRWLGLSAKGYGIHGTNVPSSIGRSASHGCIRMRNRDVEQLFHMVAVGDRVELLGERTPESARIFAGPAQTAGDNNN